MAPLARLVARTQCSKFGARLRNRFRADCAGPRSSASLRLLYQPSRSALHSLAGASTFVRPLSGRSASGRARPRAPSRRETAPERLGRAPKLVPHSGQRPRPLGPSPASAACRRSADGFWRAALFGAHIRLGDFKRVMKACAEIWASFAIAPTCRHFCVPAERSRLFRAARVSAHIWDAGRQ